MAKEHKTFVLVLALIAASLGLLGLSSAEAVSCGDTLGPGGSFTLTADLGPCTTTDALIVQGPTTVDLGGHTVSCNSGGGGSNGIEIVGSGAVVKNGRVTACVNRGVDVQGSGSHQIRNVLSDHSGEGFVIGSAHNVLLNNAAVSNDGEGFIVQFSSSSNALTGNTAVDNFGAGFDLLGNSNALTGNTAAKNVGDGFLLVASSRNALRTNTASANAVSGFHLDGTGNNYNVLVANNAFDNGSIGISVETGSTHNSMAGNVALGHPTVDLFDGNAGCDTDVWTGDIFGTKSPTACIH